MDIWNNSTLFIPTSSTSHSYPAQLRQEFFSTEVRKKTPKRSCKECRCSVSLYRQTVVWLGRKGTERKFAAPIEVFVQPCELLF